MRNLSSRLSMLRRAPPQSLACIKIYKPTSSLHLQRRPAINQPSSAGHKARPRAAHKHEHIRDLFRLRDPSHRYDPVHDMFQRGIASDRTVDHRRLDPGRADGVDPNAVGRVVESC